MRALAAMTALLLAPALAGCAQDDGEAARADVGLVVGVPIIAPGRCSDGNTSFGQSCHRVPVTVDNRANARLRETGPAHWKATDSSGKERLADMSSAATVDAKATGNVVVSFSLPDGPTRLRELRYDSFTAGGKADIATYGF